MIVDREKRCTEIVPQRLQHSSSLIQKTNMMVESETADATRRLNVKKQTLDDAYAVPANFLEIDVVNPMTTITAGKKRYTDYEVRMRVSEQISSLK